MSATLLDRLDFEKGGGLVPVIAQDHVTGEVLMLGYGSRESLDRSVESGLLTFHSRARDALWTKGETSGNVLRIVALRLDCDGDTVLALVEPAGPACHTGARSCFGAPPTLVALDDTIQERREQTAEVKSAAGADARQTSYTGRLLGDRNLRLKKLGEEATELAVACADGDAERVADEAADLIYHVLVACAAENVRIGDVLRVLEERKNGGPAAS